MAWQSEEVKNKTLSPINPFWCVMVDMSPKYASKQTKYCLVWSRKTQTRPYPNVLAIKLFGETTENDTISKVHAFDRKHPNYLIWIIWLLTWFACSSIWSSPSTGIVSLTMKQYHCYQAYNHVWFNLMIKPAVRFNSHQQKCAIVSVSWTRIWIMKNKIDLPLGLAPYVFGTPAPAP